MASRYAYLSSSRQAWPHVGFCRLESLAKSRRFFTKDISKIDFRGAKNLTWEQIFKSTECEGCKFPVLDVLDFVPED